MDALTDAVSLLRAGNAAAARARLLAAPDASATHAFLLGACAHALGDLPAAVAAFADALRRDGAHAQAACALSSLYAGLGRRAEAEALLRQTLARVEDDQLRFNLAVLQEDDGKEAAALALYGDILARSPTHLAARHNRAGLHARGQRLAEAAADYRVLVRDHPGHTLAWHNLGELELALGHYEAATACLSTVRDREPGNGKALLSLAVAQAANGDIADSRDSFARLRQVDPARWEEARARLNDARGDDDGIDPRLLFLVRQESHLMACNWRHWPRYVEVFRDYAASPGRGDSLALGYASMLAPLQAAGQLALMRHLGAQAARRAAGQPHAPRPAPSRLRLGYAAPNLGRHVTGMLFHQIFHAHDKAAVEVHLLQLRDGEDSPELAALRRAPGVVVHDLGALDDAAAAARLRALDLDVLVDLAVYNDRARPEVVAARPAPVQVAWQGAAYSSGAPWLDYVISDATVRPGDGWCSEAEVLLPGSYFVASHEAPPAVPARATLGLPADKFVFACLNAPVKLEPAVFDCWMRILAACPDSVLWLLGSGGAPQVLNLKREAEWRGVDPRRLLFANRVAPAEHLARQGAADLVLDTFLFNGHTTTAEALWAGTPVLTCPGETFASRVGASLVRDAGLPELVADNREAYEQLAVALYRDRPRLAALRARLAESRLGASCFDVPTMARHIEAACRHMRERFAAGLPPAPFAVADLAG